MYKKVVRKDTYESYVGEDENKAKLVKVHFSHQGKSGRTEVYGGRRRDPIDKDEASKELRRKSDLTFPYIDKLMAGRHTMKTPPQIDSMFFPPIVIFILWFGRVFLT